MRVRAIYRVRAMVKVMVNGGGSVRVMVIMWG